uniref:Protein transport protein SEC23 n=1 Tax=Alexandrium monilatum TaxID=311494 RepID=A0A7S4V591_9DINO
MAWNVWPCSRLDAARIVVPMGCLYTPLKVVDDLLLVRYRPVLCRGRECGAALNPLSYVDFRAKIWVCPFCMSRNAFPPEYTQQISETNLPAELLPTSSTIEYIVPGVVGSPPVFLFVLDLALQEEELEQAKDSIQQSLALMPSGTLVGLITFGAMCCVHEIATPNVQRASVFRGTKAYSALQVSHQLRLRSCSFAAPGLPAIGRFLVSASECDLVLSSLLDDLARDPWSLHRPPACRPHRCTGTALGVAVTLLEATCSHRSARIMLLAGGPCNVGPGMVVGEPLAETIRSHLDLQKGTSNARYTEPAAAFYGSLAQRAVKAGFAIDVFACSLDQVGLFEMKVFAERTGGYVVMTDSFSIHVFKESFRKVFECDDEGHLQLGFGAQLEVFTSRDVQCCGAIGGLASLGHRGPCVSESEIGLGGTSRWASGSLDGNSTVAFYFDMKQEAESASSSSGPSFLQFQTSYMHPRGQKRVRVTSLSLRHAALELGDIVKGFDQEAAAVLVARLAVEKCRTEDPLDVLRWVDQRLIRLCARFADYRRDCPASFRLAPEMASFPQFIYHLRRSQLLQTFNASPDETAFVHMALLRENTLNSIVMIQPALLQYSFSSEEPVPVKLDSENMQPDVILLLDAFFHVVIWRGERIQGWYDAGYQEREEYANFKALLRAPARDAKLILADRFPVPRYVSTSAGGSQERFLTSRVNPSRGPKTFQDSGGAPKIFTDDASLEVFVEHLIRHCVQH